MPLDALSRTHTNSFRDAPPTEQPHGLPLVVLSPGFTKPRGTLTALAEDLASHGYLVVAVDHTHETVGTTFPDGRITTCLARETPRRDKAFWQKVAAGRAADVSFVLDELTGPAPVWPHADLIDRSRIAMAGHSAGGASAIAALPTDSRIRAAVDIDGSTDTPLPPNGLRRPVLFLGKRASYMPGSGNSGAATWERDWARLTGWRRWLVVTGAVHMSFTDLGLLAEQFGLDTRAGLPATRALDITRRYVRAFLDLHLRGTAQPVLDGPSEHYPEITFCSPDAAPA